MSATQQEADPPFKLARVLFIDVVGFSSRRVDEQTGIMDVLNNDVRSVEQSLINTQNKPPIGMPTGDGMALAFFDSPETPVRFAVALARSLRQHPDFGVRIGIHTGPVEVRADINDRPNVTGAGINLAQRVMDPGDAGHILLSKRVADDLQQYTRWASNVHELGVVATKHGAMELANFYGADFNNAVAPTKVVAQEQRPIAAVTLCVVPVARASIALGRRPVLPPANVDRFDQSWTNVS